MKSISQTKQFLAEDADKLLDVTTPGETRGIKIEISECPALMEITNLKEFTTWHLSWCNLPVINQNNNVTDLLLHNPVSLNGIAHFSTLKKLRIIYNAGSKCELLPLKHLSKIEHLDVSGNKTLTSLQGIENLKNLKILDLTDTSNLTDLSSLKELRIPEIRIKGCNKEKKDFPAHLQNSLITS